MMEKKESMLVHVSKGLEEMEGAHRATGISSSGRTGGLADLSVVPDSEVPEKAVRRRFTAELQTSYSPGGGSLQRARSVGYPFASGGVILLQSDYLAATSGAGNISGAFTEKARSEGKET